MLLSSRGFYIGFFSQTLLISAIFCLSVCRWAISVCFSRCFLACFLIYDVDSGISSVVLTLNDSTRDYNLCDARIRTLRRTKKDMTTIYCNGCLLILHQPALSFSSWIWTFRPERTDWIVPVCVWRIAQREYVSKDVMSFRNRHRSCFELSLMSPFARAISECVLPPLGRKFKLEFAATVRHYRWPWKKYIPSQSRFAMARKRLFSRFTISKDPSSVGIWIPILFSCLS